MAISKPQFIKIIAIFVLTILIGIGAFVTILYPQASSVDKTSFTSNVKQVAGEQVIEITSGGGFFPNTTVAKSGIKTVLKFTGNGAVDCSNTLSIPKLNIKNQTLSLNSTTQFDIDAQSSNTVADGSCSMGMYNFKIVFI